jgi:glutaredoxin-like protein
MNNVVFSGGNDPMPLLREQDRQHLIEDFKGLKDPVKLLMFTQELECQYCRETRMVAEEVAELSGSISLEVYDFVADKEVADKYGIDKIPALAVLRDGDAPRDYGIRFYGIPSGYEFSTVIEDIMMVSHGESGLSEASKTQVAALTKPVHIQVFVTPT